MRNILGISDFGITLSEFLYFNHWYLAGLNSFCDIAALIL